MGDEDRRGDFGAVWQRVLDMRVKRRKLLSYTALGVGAWWVSALVGCSKTGETPRPAAEGTKTPKRGGVIRIQQNGDPPHYDPQLSSTTYIASMYRYVSHRLVKLDKGVNIPPAQVKVVPDLAEKWEQPDETTYIFKLRQGVKWHDRPPVNGREFVADDAVFTYRRFTAKENPMAGLLDDVDRFEAKDDYTVAFYLKGVSASFLTSLAFRHTWLVSRDIVEKEGNLKSHPPVGMGPFIFVSHDRNLNVIYKRNPNWFGKPLPYLDELHSLILPDINAQQAAFLAGGIDNYLTNSVAEANDIRSNFPAANYESFLATNWHSPIINTRRAPLSDKRVRKAISLTADRQHIFRKDSCLVLGYFGHS